MAQYIDKSALVAELKRLQDALQDLAMMRESMRDYANGGNKIINTILSFLDTLETKEVDLEKELKILDNTLFDLDGVAVQGATHYLTVEDVKDIAKYFYELGLAQKGE